MQIRKVPPEYKKKYVTYPLVPAKIVTTTTKKTKKTKCNIALLHSPIANLQIFKSWEQNSLEPTKSKIDRIAVGYKVSSTNVYQVPKNCPLKKSAAIPKSTAHVCGCTSSYVASAGDCLVNSAMPFFKN